MKLSPKKRRQKSLRSSRNLIASVSSTPVVVSQSVVLGHTFPMMRRPKHMRSGGSSAKQPLERRATTPPAPAPATPDLQVKKQDLQMMVLGRGGVGKSGKATPIKLSMNELLLSI